MEPSARQLPRRRERWSWNSLIAGGSQEPEKGEGGRREIEEGEEEEEEEEEQIIGEENIT